MDIYERLFVKMAKMGFPVEYEGYKMIYDFKNYQADLKIFPTVEKIKKMWELLNG